MAVPLKRGPPPRPQVMQGRARRAVMADAQRERPIVVAFTDL
jgi:hypothetical protein